MSDNPIEEELFYADKDHSLAHGYGPLDQRRRTMTIGRISESRLKNKDDSQANNDIDIPKRTRRGSVDLSVKSRRFLIDVESTKKAILAQEDTDGDCQITIHDAGPKAFALGTADSGGFKKYEIRGTYALSNLLQELALASDYGRKMIVIDEARLHENPVDRLSRLIKFHFWDGLTRRIDSQGLERICADPKNRSGDKQNRIYIPFHDAFALDYYQSVAKEKPHLQLAVIRLPEVIHPEFVRSINRQPGILSLALRQQDGTVRGAPFVVPGGRFNEMYGWDSYFEALGLLVDDRVELARGMVENFWYEVEHYGKILNANRSYYLTRSQPPFLTDMCVQVHERLRPKLQPDALHEWLANGVRASLKELLSVWLCAPRLDARLGLSKYHPEGIGMPPETEATHFDHIVEPYAAKHGLSISEFVEQYNSGLLAEPELDAYFVHDRAVRESGHDTTYRFEKRCANLATIDLNALVYKYEVDLASLLRTHFDGMMCVCVRRGPDDLYFNQFVQWRNNLKEKNGINGALGNFGGWNSVWAKGICVYQQDDGYVNCGSHDSPSHYDVIPAFDSPSNSKYFYVYFQSRMFDELAEHTQKLVSEYLWCPRDCLFYDWDCALWERSTYETVTCFWALWAGCATPEQAEKMVPAALAKFEVIGGLVSGTEDSRGAISIGRPNRQWDYPFGWAPHQMLAWAGLVKFGFTDVARRVCYRWLYTLTKSFVDFNGVVPEKFDIVNMTHRVNVEYGNVGADFHFVVREGFGWMNASYKIGLPYLTQYMLRALGNVTHPGQLFKNLK